MNLVVLYNTTMNLPSTHTKKVSFTYDIAGSQSSSLT